jgi:hypothetical protein
MLKSAFNASPSLEMFLPIFMKKFEVQTTYGWRRFGGGMVNFAITLN